ncbi:MAG: SOS response-associated peptidase [Nocardioidaceae bacterium]|nr:SOS response-associated peptidase [Nocardioidaceae bacterium]
MCGRYASSRSGDDLVDEFDLDPAAGVPVVPVDYNVAPTKHVPVVLARSPRAEPDAAPVRRLQLARWGLVPSWAKDPSIGNKMINARLETAAEKPSFRKAFASRRALVPADGYYEWYASTARDAKGKPVKQPFFIRPQGGGVLAMAGLYELWRDPAASVDDDPWLWSFTILTTRAEDDLGRLHDRMPLLLEPSDHSRWLDPHVTDTADVTSMLVPAAPGRLEAFPVSRSVNNVRNEGPELVEPIPLSDVPDDVLAVG